MNEEIKEMLNNVDSNTKFKMVDENGTTKEMNIAGLIEQLLNDNKYYIIKIKQKDNIIDELEKYLKQQLEYYKLDIDYYVEYKMILNKLKELKEGKE